MPRIRFRDMGTATANRAYPPFTATRAVGITTGAGASWAPRAFTISEFTAKAPAAPGVGTAVDFQTNQNDNVPIGDLGSPVSLAGAATSVRGTMNAPVSIVGARDATEYTIREILTGSPTGQVTHNGIAYTCTNPDQDVSLYSFGQSPSGIFTPSNPVFLKPCSALLKTTATPAFLIWPATGTFKFFAFINVGGNFDGNVDFTLQIDGGASITFTPSNGVSVFTDYLQTLAITNGQYVYWKATRNSGALNPTVAIIWGFGF
jgi:hypothetical protein